MNYKKTRSVWYAMRQRCNNQNDASFKYYGGRGIKICERWDDFKNFIADMGCAPINLQIDRIDNDKGYYKENCRWATVKEQQNNKSSNLTPQEKEVRHQIKLAKNLKRSRFLCVKCNEYKMKKDFYKNKRRLKNGNLIVETRSKCKNCCLDDQKFRDKMRRAKCT